jgi:hypothetical protein
VEDPANPGTGFLLVVVPRSSRQPHAVLVNEGLRYPRRNGSTTRYLAEAEVAAAYRDRFFSFGAQSDRAGDVERDLLARLATDRWPWVVISLVPDLPGDLVIDAAARRSFRAEVVGIDPLIVPGGVVWQRVSVGRRRLVADGTMRESPLASWLGAELHSDGAGAFAVVVRNLNEGRVGGSETERLIDDEDVVLGILSGLRLLARHARDRAAAGGEALVRVQLHPVGEVNLPLRLGHTRGFMDMGGTLGDQVVNAPVRPAQLIVPLDDLADGGPDLIATGALLSSDLFQAFGYPEVTQVTREGQLRKRYWSRGRWPELETWANSAGIELLEDEVDLS